jgi:hypothetical protein
MAVGLVRRDLSGMGTLGDNLGGWEWWWARSR